MGSNEGCIRRAFTLNDKFNPEQANFVGTPVREKSSEFSVQKHSKKNKLLHVCIKLHSKGEGLETFYYDLQK
ncbi:hypothetical protein [Leptospira alexanderi]|uniref:hypothetical protein n=1 Tax=Leptospira alexanderi TaxID=100053 RepID=UPI0009911DC8|nr:hypothetical protein [Leptospira alexanderi]